MRELSVAGQRYQTVLAVIAVTTVLQSVDL